MFGAYAPAMAYSVGKKKRPALPGVERGGGYMLW